MFLAPFETAQELDDLLSDFEAQTLPQIRWTHREHIAVAALYVRRGPQSAEEEMRTGILKLNAAHGVENTETAGYHETLTVAWVQLLILLSQQNATASNLEFVNQALTTFADKRLLLTYYSREKLMSLEARRLWVEPDLLPLGFKELEVSNEN